MKKSTILSLATAGAIVATSAFTFAAWDQLDSTATVGKLKINEPVSVTVTPDTSSELATTSDHGTDAPVYKGTANVVVDNVPADYKLDAEATVYKDGSEVPEGSVTATAILAAGSDLTDGTKTINVEVKPADNEAGKALAGQDLTVEVTAKLVKDSTPAS